MSQATQKEIEEKKPKKINGKEVVQKILEGKGLPKRYFLFGPSGSGKTLRSILLAAKHNESYYDKALSRYWNNYKGEKVVVVDGVTSENYKYIKSGLEKWMDYSSFNGLIYKGKKEGGEEVETEDVIIDPKEYTLIVTSRESPDDLFREESEIKQEKLKKFFVFEECEEVKEQDDKKRLVKEWYEEDK